MTKEEVCSIIEEVGIIPAIRAPSAADALFGAAAVYRGGIHVIELTMTVPGAIGVLSELRRTYPDLVTGAGTVVDLDTARACLDAGAQFLTSPGFDPEIVHYALKENVAAIPGALTPTEILMASKAGADFVKVFPCSQLGGPTYIRALRAPFPRLRLIASGGVTQLTAADFIRAGANALGIREDLIPSGAVEAHNEDWIHELSHRFLGIVKRARGRQV